MAATTALIWHVAYHFEAQRICSTMRWMANGIMAFRIFALLEEDAVVRRVLHYTEGARYLNSISTDLGGEGLFEGLFYFECF